VETVQAAAVANLFLQEKNQTGRRIPFCCAKNCTIQKGGFAFFFYLLLFFAKLFPPK